MVRQGFWNRVRWAGAVFCAGTVVAVAATAGPSTPPASSPRPGDDAYDWQHWQQFWSFRPIAKPTPPAVTDATWVRNPIDAFVLAKLDEKGLRPAPEADKVSLIRRVTYDLTGVPPSPQEIRAFVTDKSPDAYEKVVDRLLASPHYGEKWGRHWLDVARYVQGRITFPGIKHTAGDSAYRDYVVRALNKDKPYDQFVTEQIAGDLLPPAADREQEADQIAAPAFLSIGPWFDMCTDPNRLKLEMVDDQVNATSKAFLGLSMACARCHDHKFDPIPTADYYALGGVFKSTRLVGDLSEFWRDGRVRQLRPMAMPDEVAANDAIKRQIDAIKAEQWAYASARHGELMASWKVDEARYRAAAAKVKKPWTKLFEAEEFDGVAGLRIGQLSKDGKSIDVLESLNSVNQWVKYKITVPETGEYRLEALYCRDDRVPLQVTVNGPTQIAAALAEPTGGWDLKFLRWGTVGTLNMRVGTDFVRLYAKEGEFPRVDRFRIFRTDEGFDDDVAKVAAAEGLSPQLLANFVVDPDRPHPTIAGIGSYLPPEQQKTVDARTAEMNRLDGTLKPYDLIVAVNDQPADKCEDLAVRIKGNTYALSKVVPPRGVPRLFDHLLPPPQVPAGASGRLELAKWLTDPRNPLPARVMVNRLWQGHFGRGLVATSSDFGSRGTPPTHPELLDWLASTFVEQGWSLKQMHRLILLSATYRMRSEPAPETESLARQVDPDNKFLSHFTRRRLEAEELYDAMLAASNRLVRQEPGKPLDVDKSKNRAMYTLVSGRSPKGLGMEVRKMFNLFDYDPSGASIDVRPTSTTPAQSLFWLNNPVPRFYADLFADRLLKMDQLTDAKRADMAYLLAVGRSPGKEMLDQSLAYIEQCQRDEGMSKQEAWTQFCLAVYASTEFRYVD